MPRLAAVLILSVLACAPTVAPVPAPAPATTVRTLPAIEREQLRADVFAFAHDSMLGRRSGTGNDVRAASFIVQQLEGLGLEPAGDSGYFHRVPLTELRAGPGSVVRVLEGQRVTDVALGTLAPLRQLGPELFTRLEASGELLFGAYGVPIPQLNRNDLDGLNLSGRMVVMINGGPAGLDSAQRATYETQQAFGQRLQLLVEGGAAGIIMLFTGEFGDQIRSAMPQLLQSISLRAEEREVQRALPLILIGHLDDAPAALLPAGWPQNDAAGPLSGRRMEARIVEQRRHFTSYNVAGVLRGADPAHNRTYVALGAHLDHIGVVPPQNGDSIANGADDNASGSMALVAIARSVSRMEQRPRRSLLFVWHTAEEEGLLGAQHFTTQPPMPVDSIVAQINADMISRNHPDSLYIVGPRAAPGEQSAVLGGIADSVNAALQRPFSFNREWDDPGHPEQIYVRSDHYAYAQQGIPVVFFTSGLHDDYHAVTDHANLIDHDKLVRVADYIMRLAVAVADRPGRPRPAR